MFQKSAGIGIGNPARKRRRVTGAQQGRHVTPALIGIRRTITKWPDPLAPGKGNSGVERIFPRIFKGLGGGFRVDPDRAQVRGDSLRTEPAPCQRSAARGGKARIVDISKLRAAFDYGIYRRLTFVFPTTLIQLADKVDAQFMACRRILAEVVERERVERMRIERLGNPGRRREFAA